MDIDIKEVYKKLYPLTIVMDRYTGVYSGGKFTAWNLDPDEIPEEICWDDLSASEIFRDIRNGKRNIVYGIGATPDEAAMDLYMNITYQENKDRKATWGLRKALQIIDKYQAEARTGHESV